MNRCMRLGFIVIMMLWVVLLAGNVHAGGEFLKVGFAKTHIMPPLGVELSGYTSNGSRTALGINDPVCASAVYFANDTGQAMIINTDTLGFDIDFVKRLKGEICSETGLTYDQIMILSTHTHSAPVTMHMGIHKIMDYDYMENLANRLVDVAVKAIQDSKVVSESKSFVWEFEGIGYNRVVGDSGPLENVLRGVVFDRANGRPVLLINYGCHPVSMGVNHEISADYPGAVVDFLNKEGYHAMFLQGCAGDIDPIKRGTYAIAQELGHSIAKASLEGLVETGQTLTDYTISTISREARVPVFTGELDRETVERRFAIFQRSMEERATKLEHDPVFRYEFTTEYMRYKEGVDAIDNGRNVYLQAIAIGDVVFVGFPGETFTELGLMVKRAFPRELIMTLGQANGNVGYIATKDDIERKGYGGYTSHDFVYCRLPFAPGAGESLAEEAIMMVDELLWKNEN